MKHHGAIRIQSLDQNIPALQKLLIRTRKISCDCSEVTN